VRDRLAIQAMKQIRHSRLSPLGKGCSNQLSYIRDSDALPPIKSMALKGCPPVKSEGAGAVRGVVSLKSIEPRFRQSLWKQIGNSVDPGKPRGNSEVSATIGFWLFSVPLPAVIEMFVGNELPSRGLDLLKAGQPQHRFERLLFKNRQGTRLKWCTSEI